MPGGTITARRLFDAIVAGCIPIIVTGFDTTEKHNESNAMDVQFRMQETMNNLPFSVKLTSVIVLYAVILFRFLIYCLFKKCFPLAEKLPYFALKKESVPWTEFAIFIDQYDWFHNTQQSLQRIMSLPKKEHDRLRASLRQWKGSFDYRDPTNTLNKHLVQTFIRLTSNLTAMSERMQWKGRPLWAWHLIGYDNQSIASFKKNKKFNKRLRREELKSARQNKWSQQKKDGIFIPKSKRKKV